MFIVYELLVSIMLINMLIASMARTYDEIALTQKEWKRQVCINLYSDAGTALALTMTQ